MIDATRRSLRTYLVHLEKRFLLHLLEGDDLVTLLVASKVDFSVASLTDLGEDVELVELELGTTLAEEDALSALVRVPFDVGLLLRQRPRFD